VSNPSRVHIVDSQKITIDVSLSMNSTENIWRHNEKEIFIHTTDYHSIAAGKLQPTHRIANADPPTRGARCNSRNGDTGSNPGTLRDI
jgi:hypothetical protein